MSTFIFAKIIRILDEQNVLINAGYEQGVRPGDLFHIIQIGEDITDPDTAEILGKLEIVKAAVEAYHVQERMTLLSTMPTDSPAPSTSVLSATLASTSSYGRTETDPNRLSLRVRHDQVKSYSSQNPVALGDVVRSVLTAE